MEWGPRREALTRARGGAPWVLNALACRGPGGRPAAKPPDLAPGQPQARWVGRGRSEAEGGREEGGCPLSSGTATAARPALLRWGEAAGRGSDC